MNPGKLIFGLIAAMMITLAACTPKASPTAAGQGKVTYTCPMHPEVVSDKPGSCPKCGMDLVTADAKGGHNHGDCKMKRNKDGYNYGGSGGGCGMR
jgi:hypothetical protein